MSTLKYKAKYNEQTRKYIPFEVSVDGKPVELGSPRGGPWLDIVSTKIEQTLSKRPPSKEE